MTLGKPKATYTFDFYQFDWEDPAVTVRVERIHSERDGLKGDLQIVSGVKPRDGILVDAVFNMSSQPTRNSMAKHLKEREESIDWTLLLEMVCLMTKQKWREGSPVYDLAKVDLSADPPYLLYPLILEGASTVLFADGGSGKSMVAIAAGLSIAGGYDVIEGMHPRRKGPVIYFDWEWDKESHAERLAAVCAGIGWNHIPEGMIHYQRMTASLLDSLPQMRYRVAETGAIACIVDSLGFARGGEPNSADLTTRVFSGLRTLGIPALVLDHVAKGDPQSTHSFGSAYTFNSARMMWRIDVAKEEGMDNFYMAFVNTKSNRKIQKGRGYNVNVVTDEEEKLLSVAFQSTDWRDLVEQGLKKTGTPLIQQLVELIEANRSAGNPTHEHDLFLALQASGSKVSEAVVRATLYGEQKRPDRRVLKVDRNWGLAAVHDPDGEGVV